MSYSSFCKQLLAADPSIALCGDRAMNWCHFIRNSKLYYWFAKSNADLHLLHLPQQDSKNGSQLPCLLHSFLSCVMTKSNDAKMESKIMRQTAYLPKILKFEGENHLLGCAR